ncbi:putative SAM-dependent methyltransferases [Magnetospirillum gryphiswaldense MSR-1 v2]|uniref:SAM-dependent methyltransferases n=1 Tax=Magnetospirillum gryphiswaldense (strain DSM 6361 / JCM 21280 / NBRC 15271 / MSR-1) TaxID=431944 RepID=V6F794_MAGGM|nr:class I SAM-dependent methyltransferase [Magnetospirillum gryphiswaldense]CDL01385.1 putative SAM-dependent methyltransferases [Magnetospirillum gryphiswaldense MSR-1 v2]
MQSLPSYPGTWSDVVDLRDFYDSGLGQTTKRLLRRHLRQLWPDTHGLCILGLGFATPLLRPFVAEAERVIAVMPANQGVLHWPPEGPGLTVLADESDLPLPDSSMDRIVLMHALESTEQVRAMMREVWRVLADGGRLVIIVPNRRGIWARLERTPFGNGRPYTGGQLTRLLRDNMFTPVSLSGALFMPPTNSRVLLRSAPAMEELGRRWFHTIAGIHMVEATKQIYAATPSRTSKRRGYVIAPQGF